MLITHIVIIMTCLQLYTTYSGHGYDNALDAVYKFSCYGTVAAYRPLKAGDWAGEGM